MTWIAAGAGIAFGLALVLLTIFFVTGNQRADRVAEWAFVVFALLAVPTIAAVGVRYEPDSALAWPIAALGIAGALGLGAGELLSALRVIDFRRMATAITVAFMAFLLWLAATSGTILTLGRFPAALGWLGVGSIAVGAVVIASIAMEPGVLRGERQPAKAQMKLFMVPMAGIVAWLVWLGLSL